MQNAEHFSRYGLFATLPLVLTNTLGGAPVVLGAAQVRLTGGGSEPPA